MQILGRQQPKNVHFIVINNQRLDFKNSEKIVQKFILNLSTLGLFLGYMPNDEEVCRKYCFTT